MRPFALVILCSLVAAESHGAKVGGTLAPDGKTEIHCDLPDQLHRSNITSRGQGCCVFRSLHHAALYQNVPALYDFPEWLRKKGLAGGGNASNVRARIAAICKERGVPQPSYVQIHSRDLELLKAACKSGRLVCVTYSRSPTGRYNGNSIAHMVNLPHADDNYFAVLDNNAIGARNYEWMTPAEFVRYCNPRGYWAIVLLAPPPPPPPQELTTDGPIIRRRPWVESGGVS